MAGYVSGITFLESAFTASLQRGDSRKVKVRALLAERQRRLGYEAQLRAAVMACQ